MGRDVRPIVVAALAQKTATGQGGMEDFSRLLQKLPRPVAADVLAKASPTIEGWTRTHNPWYVVSLIRALVKGSLKGSDQAQEFAGKIADILCERTSTTEDLAPFAALVQRIRDIGLEEEAAGVKIVTCLVERAGHERSDAYSSQRILWDAVQSETISHVHPIAIMEKVFARSLHWPAWFRFCLAGSLLSLNRNPNLSPLQQVISELFETERISPWEVFRVALTCLYGDRKSVV